NLEFLQRLSADWPEIRAALRAGDDPGAMVAVDGGAGDGHGGGRSVMILSFRSGFRLVYKPRPLAADRHFQDLLAWLNERGDHPPPGAPDREGPDAVARLAFWNSVLGVGLLPERIWAGAGSEGMDISGLGGAAGQLTAYQVPAWEGAGTDEMRLTRTRVELGA